MGFEARFEGFECGECKEKLADKQKGPSKEDTKSHHLGGKVKPCWPRCIYCHTHLRQVSRNLNLFGISVHKVWNHVHFIVCICVCLLPVHDCQNKSTACPNLTMCTCLKEAWPGFKLAYNSGCSWYPLWAQEGLSAKTPHSDDWYREESNTD